MNKKRSNTVKQSFRALCFNILDFALFFLQVTVVTYAIRFLVKCL